jgi:hypothetical protein
MFKVKERTKKSKKYKEVGYITQAHTQVTLICA